MRMASTSTSRDVDIEAQQDILQPPGLAGNEMREMEIRPLEMKGDSIRASTVSANQKAIPEVGLGVSPATADGERETYEPDNHQSGHVDDTRQTPTRIGHDRIQGVAQGQATPGLGPISVVGNSLSTGGGSHDVGSIRESCEKRMIGDFDGSANALWTLYGKEAESHDKSRIQTLKDDMDGVLIFAGLFSAALTAFIIDSKQNLKASPSDQMVYYLQQNVALLSQVSQQISFLAPQFAIPTTPPPPFPTFKPSISDVRVNAFWFMALAFSLSAALLAILVQQWVRDYMYVFQRYSDPLKSARIRQYLHEGAEGWHMPVVAESVPCLLHISLFLFFVGLGDFVLDINTTVGLSTIVPIGTIGLLYTFTTFAPLLYPQSPYQTSFSGFIWYIIQRSKLFGRRFRDRDGGSKLVSTHMAQGQMQLAMEETEDRKGRDVQAIQWLVENLTEDSEMESFAMAIPGSFNGEWSFEVWTKVSRISQDENKSTDQVEPVSGPLTDIRTYAVPPVVSQPLPHSRTILGPFNSSIRLFMPPAACSSPTNSMTLRPIQYSSKTHHSTSITPSRNVPRELSSRIAHLFRTCKNRPVFASDELWRRRTRACVEATTSLICYADAELNWFGDILEPLGNIGSYEKTRELSLAGMDQSFVMRWTCLSIMTIRRMLSVNESVKKDARTAIECLGELWKGDGPDDEVAERNAQRVDQNLMKEWRHRLTELRWIFYRHQIPMSRKMLDILDERPEASEWGESKDKVDLKSVDSKISNLQGRIDEDSYRISRQLPGIQFNDLCSAHLPAPTLELLCGLTESTFVFPQQILDMFHQLSTHFSSKNYRPTDREREAIEGLLYWQENLLQRQLWRLQDLRDGGALGFAVELFFIVLGQLLSTSSSQDSHSVLYVATFRAIVSDWGQYKYSLGTQKILLDTVASNQGIVHRFNYPTYITDELLALLEHILEGQSGPHIENAVQQLSQPDDRRGVQELRTKALRVISRSRTSPS